MPDGAAGLKAHRQILTRQTPLPVSTGHTVSRENEYGLPADSALEFRPDAGISVILIVRSVFLVGSPPYLWEDDWV